MNELLLHGQMTLSQVVDSLIEKLGTQGECLIIQFCQCFFVICGA